MRLSFLNRHNERRRLSRAFAATSGSFCCLYGRRRCGKSRLLNELLSGTRHTYYVADECDAEIQRRELAHAAEHIIPAFGQVRYPDWYTLLQRWWDGAPDGAVLVIDEFPYLVSVSPELPTVLQKIVDRYAERPLHLVLCGSSQRMMQGLVLDDDAPLYGRAREIIAVEPLGAAWLKEAFPRYGPFERLLAYAAWGGVPRYWELAAEFASTSAALQDLVLDPMGVLHREPRRILHDDMRETVQASSILTLVGRGCSRLSEIASRLNKPATSLTRPLSRLCELGLIRKEVPFGVNPKTSKKTLYSVGEPFIAMWYRFVEPNRSRLEAGAIEPVLRQVWSDFPVHAGFVWEELVRKAVANLEIGGRRWLPAQRWWGRNREHDQMELDAVAESADGKSLLVGEAKIRVTADDMPRLAGLLQRKAALVPFAEHYREVMPVVFAESGAETIETVGMEDVLAALP